VAERGAAPSVVPTDALVDEARLAIFRRDYDDIAGKLASLFADSTPPLLDELRAAHDAGDGEGLRRAAHKLKGSCQNIGATFMATLAASLEGAPGDAEALAGLEAAFGPTREALYASLGSE
jgi:HPt (histidine-containing phosphotransfer) domain-containing protein